MTDDHVGLETILRRIPGVGGYYCCDCDRSYYFFFLFCVVFSCTQFVRGFAAVLVLETLVFVLRMCGVSMVEPSKQDDLGLVFYCRLLKLELNSCGCAQSVRVYGH